MNEKEIDVLVRARILRRKQVDISKTRSLVKSAGNNVNVVKKIPLDDNSATLIFREIYESIRQLGEANWIIRGFEPLNHEISLDGFKDMSLKESIKLNYLPRFKKIRNDVNYNGFIVSIGQASEIVDFWNKCGNEIIDNIQNKLNNFINHK
ncbi:hypothetical protein GOV12_01240 [Candidatus Pacearchaeota archaeon]|nr:hypothetical protein [Candidatus Pacearchaeota archaeon]